MTHEKGATHKGIMAQQMQRGALLRAFDQREAKRRVDEGNRTEMVKYFAEDKMLQANGRCEQRSEHVRREKEARARAGEQARMEALYMEHKAAQFAQASAEEDARIAGFMEQKHKEKQRKDMFVAKVANESEELRSLKEKLRTAEVTMQRKLQLEEKQLIEGREKEYESGMDAVMEKYRLALVEAEDEKARRRRMELMGKDGVLLEQMEEKRELQRAARKEFEREKEAVAEIVRKINEEDALEAKRRKDKQVATKKYIDDFMVQREELRQQKRRDEQAEEDAIAAYNEAVEARNAEEASRKQKVKDEQDRILYKMKLEKEAEMRKREELEDLLNRLHFEEQEAKWRAKKREKAEKDARSRQEMLQANDYQMHLKAQRRQKEMEEEEEYRRRMFAKFAEDERKEKEGEERRQANQRAFHKEVEDLAQLKRGMYEEQKARELAEYMEFQEQERQRQEVIEQERQRMLKEYAVKLMDYLPKGTLSKPEDLDLLMQLLGEKYDNA